ncbi:MAG TPA: proline racemase family protein [Phycisphaerae bacterium]|nr:proline racemase family protein [Phycisphaerae bacterium]
MASCYERIQVIDSHTGGEPTRVVIAGGPELGNGPMTQRRELLANSYDAFRSAVVNEPRGSDVMVGAILTPPSNPSCVAGVIFFNNVGYLGMCGHGTIGVGVVLGHLGRIAAGTHRIETPVGIVSFDYDGENAVSITNVPSYRLATAVAVEVDGIGTVTGDIAWGGNWFFLTETREKLVVQNAERLTDIAWRIRTALEANGITGKAGEIIDHIELVGPPLDPRNHARNFMLCPGKAYDRSPCGTGTSAKLACLHASGKLKPGETWRQESIIGSVFEGSIVVNENAVIPRISGTAYVTGEGTLLIDPADPFGRGIR